MFDFVLAQTCSKAATKVKNDCCVLEVTRDTEVASGTSLGSQAITLLAVLRLLWKRGRNTSEHGRDMGNA